MKDIIEKLTESEIMLIELFLIRSMIIDKKYTISQVVDEIQRFKANKAIDKSK